MVWPFPSRRRRGDKLLAAGEVDKAIRLYRKDRAWDALVVAFRRKGDLAAAADAARQGGLLADAARLYAELKNYSQAAEMWLAAGEKDAAARAFSQTDDYEKAVALYLDLGRMETAAETLASRGQHKRAGEVLEAAGMTSQAVSVYAEGGLPAEAARLLAGLGRLEEAARLYAEAGQDAKAADLLAQAGLFRESAQCHARIGNHARAGELLEQAGYPQEAVESYARDEQCLARAADLLRRSLRTVASWRRRAKARIVCFDASRSGDYFIAGYETPICQLFHGDQALWQFKPPFTSRPLSVAVSDEGISAVGCDDKRLHFLAADKSVIWTRELPDIPRYLALDAACERLVACLGNGLLVCLDKAGKDAWEHRVRGIVCGLSLSGNGRMIAAGTTEARTLLLRGDGETAGEFNAPDWVDLVALNDDGSKCALGLGLRGVGLLDTDRRELLWTVQEESPVCSVSLAPDGAVLSVSDLCAVLRDSGGRVLTRYAAGRRLMGGKADMALRHAILWNDDHEVIQVAFQDCREQAAELYEKAGRHDEAAIIYQALGDHARAAGAFRAAGDLQNAARSIEAAGGRLEAASIYESVGEHDKAAPLYEAEGDLLRAAVCFSRAKQWVRAARLYEQLNDAGNAAELYERAGQFDKAGALYKAAGNLRAAIDALADHMRSHPDAAPLWLELGLLLKQDGQHDKAIECLQKAIQDEASRRAALIALGECFVAKDMYEIALSRYEACLKPDERPAWGNLDIFYGLGKTQQLAGNYREARSIFQSILAVDFQYEDVRQRLKDVDALGGVFQSSQAGAAMTQGMFATTPMNLFQQLSSSTKERYIVRKELGKGGMGQVFLAEDTRLKRNVALKVLAPHMAADPSVRTRMIQEAQAAAQIDHPNCVRVFDIGEEGDRCYITMEYVVGKTLRKVIEEKGRMDFAECASLLGQVAEGLAFAHRRGITHRDIKPENIIITEDGTPKIMDFGLALAPGASRLTSPGGVCGTLPYMAPEQLRGDPVLTPAVDVYAVGCMLYEMLAGTPAFGGDSITSAKMTGAPPPLRNHRPDAPAALLAVVETCLAREASDRYPDGAALAAALRGAAS